MFDEVVGFALVTLGTTVIGAASDVGLVSDEMISLESDVTTLDVPETVDVKDSLLLRFGL